VVERDQDRDKLTFCVVLAEASSQEGLASPLQERIRTVLKLRADVTFVSENDIQEAEKRILDLRQWD